MGEDVGVLFVEPAAERPCRIVLSLQLEKPFPVGVKPLELFRCGQTVKRQIVAASQIEQIGHYASGQPVTLESLSDLCLTIPCFHRKCSSFGVVGRWGLDF